MDANWSHFYPLPFRHDGTYEGPEWSDAVDLLTRRLPTAALLVYPFVFSGEVVNR